MRCAGGDGTTERVGPAHAGLLSTMHATGFDVAWSAQAMADLLATPGVLVMLGRDTDGTPQGFVMLRVAAGEVEILTIAVLPTARGRGWGRRLIRAGLDELENAETIFLEVAADNEPALALYRRLGFAAVGRRRAYYSRPDGPAMDALVLRADLPFS